MKYLHAFLQRFLIHLILILLTFSHPVLATSNIDHFVSQCDAIQSAKKLPPRYQDELEVNPQEAEDAATRASSVALALGAFFIVSKNVKSIGGCKSAELFAATAAAWFAADQLLKKNTKDALVENCKEYVKEAKNEENTANENASFEAQVRAFEYLRREQEIIVQSSQDRITAQTVLLNTYKFAIPGIVVCELLPPNLCPFNPCEGENKTIPDQHTAEARPLVDNFIPPPPLPTTDVGHSAGIAAASILMAAWSEILIGHAETERGKANANIDTIKKIIKHYDKNFDSNAGVCPQGRDDPASLRCFCFDKDGNRVIERERFKVCEEVWEQEEQSSGPAANISISLDKSDDPESQDDPESEKEPPKGCLNKDYQFDYECGCLKKDAKTGKDSCHQISEDDFSPEEKTSFNKLIGDPAAAQEISKTKKLLNSFMKGTNHALGKVSDKEIRASAQKAGKINSNLLKKLRKENKEAAKKIDDAKKYAKKITDPASWKSNKTSATKLPQEALSKRPLTSTASAQLNKASLKVKNSASNVKVAQVSPSSGTTKGGAGIKREIHPPKNTSIMTMPAILKKKMMAQKALFQNRTPKMLQQTKLPPPGLILKKALQLEKEN